MIGQGTEASLLVEIVFWVLAVSAIVSAFAVVQIRDLFRAALFLIMTLLSIAGLFILLRAEFLAAVQVLIYVGAISVLIIFSILMTGDVEEGSPSHSMKIPVAILAILFGALSIFVSVSTDWNLLEPAIAAGQISGDAVTEVYSNTIPVIASMLIRDFVLAFEVASVLLLAAVIGALALIREG
jgi:NADH-quinone oxidoreductase subunit J